MDKYLQAEKRLAELLGYKEIFRLKVDGVEHGGLQYNKSTYTGREQLPRWSRDWSAAGTLIADHLVTIGFSTKHGKCTSAFAEMPLGGVVWQDVADHPDKSIAVMFAAVLAIIANLGKAKAEG